VSRKKIYGSRLFYFPLDLSEASDEEYSHAQNTDGKNRPLSAMIA
jgi:hypothetical protein